MREKPTGENPTEVYNHERFIQLRDARVLTSLKLLEMREDERQTGIAHPDYDTVNQQDVANFERLYRYMKKFDILDE